MKVIFPFKLSLFTAPLSPAATKAGKGFPSTLAFQALTAESCWCWLTD
jgi:hypothetical protein